MKDYSKEKMRFVMKTELLIGDGIAKDLATYLKDNQWCKIGLVVDGGLFENNTYTKEIVERLKDEMDLVVLLISELPEPTYDYLDETKINFEGQNLDCFVGIGGGSALDLTKGLATLKTNAGKAIGYRGFGKVKNVPLPVVALPSTAGTGSEVTPYAVFIDTVEHWKFGINSEHNYPKLSLLDPRLLDSCPGHVFASSGMDAMTHALESYAAKNATDLSRMYSIKAFQLLFENLQKIGNGDHSKETKLNLLIGASCAGIGLMNSGAGPAGALSYPLGVFFNVPHGLAGSVFLPGVIRYNVEQGYTEYAYLYDFISENEEITDQEKSYRFADVLTRLSEELGIPTNLEGFGVKTEKDANLIIDNSMQLKAAFDQNPVVFGQREIINLIESLR